MRFFNRFDMAKNEQVQEQIYRWFFDRLSIDRLTMNVGSTVISRCGQQQVATKGYNPGKPGRNSHHPLLVFIAESHIVANFWLHPGNTHSANNILAFLEATLRHLGNKTVGLLRADRGFFDEAVMNFLQSKSITYVISVRLTQTLGGLRSGQLQYGAVLGNRGRAG